MKKKLIALALILLLAMTMTAAAFASERAACINHVWVDCGQSYLTDWYPDSEGHVRMWITPQICTVCTLQKENVISWTEQPHDYDENGVCRVCFFPTMLK